MARHGARIAVIWLAELRNGQHPTAPTAPVTPVLTSAVQTGRKPQTGPLAHFYAP